MDQAAQVAAQYEYDQKQHDFSWAQMQDNYLYEMDKIEVARLNEQASADYKNRLAATQWAQNESIRVSQYEAEIKAYNQSIESANQQLDYNALAEEIASSEQNRVYQEQLIELGFKNENILLQYHGGLEKLAESYKGQTEDLGLKYAKGLEDIEITSAHKQESIEEQAVKSLETKEREVRGRITRLESEADATDKTTLLEIKKLKEEAGSLKRNIDTARKKVKVGREQAERRAGLQIEGLTQQLMSQKAKAAYDSQEKKIATLTAEGKIASGGQTGKSAAKRMHALMSSHGRGQAALLDTLTRQDKKFALDRSQVVNTLREASETANLNYEEISNKFLDSTMQLKYRGEAAALSNSLSRDQTAEFSAEAWKEFDLVEHQVNRGKTLQLGQLDESRDLQISQIDRESTTKIDQATRNYLLGVSQAGREQDLNIRQTQEMVKSAGEAHLSKSNQIALDKYQKDIAAQAGIRPEPIEPPQAPMPVEIPESIFQDPKPITEPPKPIKGAVYQPQRQEQPQGILGGVVSSVGNVIGNVASGIGNVVSDVWDTVTGWFSDSRLKTDIEPLYTSEVTNEMAEMAFFVKEIRERT